MIEPIENPPAWDVAGWLNTPEPIVLEQLKGRVVALHAFQMLCPGCVAHGLPQAARIRECFGRNDVVVIGLHTVFEHHDVMTPRALEAFVHEYRWPFPIAIDMPSEAQAIPRTMAAYGMKGTPSLLLFDHRGRLRHHEFGRPEDMIVGARIMALLAERDGERAQSPQIAVDRAEQARNATDCTEEGCSV